MKESEKNKMAANVNTIGTLKKKKNSRTALVLHQFKKNKGAVAGVVMLLIVILAGIFSGFIWDFDTDIIGMKTADRLQTPSLAHPFGTDSMGRDLLARVCYGARYSLVIGLLAVMISFVFGVIIGALAGYIGGKFDYWVMRAVELFLMIPGIMLVIVFIAALGINMRNLIISIGLSTVPQVARTMRASAMQIRNSEYVEAARAVGCSNIKIIVTHIIPNAINSSFVYATVRFGSCITDAAAFSFLGLGVPAPLPEWGALLSDGRLYMRDYPHLIIFPGLAIMISVLAANLIGDGLRDALDPKMKR